MREKTFIGPLLICICFLVSCSHGDKKSRVKESEKVSREGMQEQQVRDDFDPSGMWLVNSASKACLAMAGYAGGNPPYQLSSFFQCQTFPVEAPVVNTHVEISYDEKLQAVDVIDGAQLRRIPLSGTDIDLAGEPLVVLEPREVAPGCEVLFGRLNGVMFMNKDLAKELGYEETAPSNNMTYLLTFSMKFRPLPDRPEACTEYLHQLGNALRNGTANDPLMQYLVQSNALDLSRIGELKDVNVIYFYDAAKINGNEQSVKR